MISRLANSLIRFTIFIKERLLSNHIPIVTSDIQLIYAASSSTDTSLNIFAADSVNITTSV